MERKRKKKCISKKKKRLKTHTHMQERGAALAATQSSRRGWVSCLIEGRRSWKQSFLHTAYKIPSASSQAAFGGILCRALCQSHVTICTEGAGAFLLFVFFQN